MVGVPDFALGDKFLPPATLEFEGVEADVYTLGCLQVKLVFQHILPIPTLPSVVANSSMKEHTAVRSRPETFTFSTLLGHGHLFHELLTAQLQLPPLLALPCMAAHHQALLLLCCQCSYSS